MKSKLCLIISAALLLSVSAYAQTGTDSAAIMNMLQEEVSSWNNVDATTYSQHFAENGTFTNIRGMFYKTVLQQEVVSFGFLRPGVAIAETLTWITGFSKTGPPPGVHIDAKGRIHTRLLQVFQKESGGWKIIVYHNVDLKQGTPVPEQQ